MMSSSLFTPLTAGRQRMVWFTLLAVASVLFNFFFACGSPFAALAAVAVLTLTLRDALALMVVAWLANQSIGFGLLGYPLDTSTFIWGGVMGLSAIIAVIAAKFAAMKSPQLALVFLVAFVAQQFSMWLAALTPLGGLDGFTFDTIGRVASVDLLGLTVFYILNRLAVALNLSADVKAQA